jgi:hypothetical protein
MAAPAVAWQHLADRFRANTRAASQALRGDGAGRSWSSEPKTCGCSGLRLPRRLTFINFWLLPDVVNDLPQRLGLDFDATEVTFAIYGFLLLIMMLLRPQGLLPQARAPGGW